MKKKGFTLIEILIVVAIIGVLISIISINITGRTTQARQMAAKANIKKFETALKMYYNDNGFYPTTEQGLKSLIKKPTTGKIPKNYSLGGYLEAQTVPKDPWGNEYVFISPGIHNKYFVDLICFGADGEEGGENENKDIANWENVQSEEE